MKLSACLIVKDDSELNSLSQAVDSIKNHVDGVYITATGEDVDGVEKLCKDNDLQYSHFPWNDSFADARNFNFSQAPGDSDYIFWMDADDIVVGGELLPEIARLSKMNGKDLVFFTYWYACTFKGEPSLTTLQKVDIEQMRERLIRPGVTTWKGRLHETPVPNNGVRENYTSYPFNADERPFAILHTSRDDVVNSKMQRNKRILELQLKEERDGGKDKADPRTLLYLMKIYAEEDDKEKWRETLEMGKEYLAKSGWDEERGTCYELMGQVYGHLDKLKESVNCFHNAINEWPHNPLFYIRLASAYYNLKNYRSARHWLDIASSMDLDKRFTSSTTNVHAMKVMFADLLVKLNYNAEKDTKKALEAARMLYKELPNKDNEQQLLFLEDQDRLNEACRNVDKLAEYLSDIGETTSIVNMLDALPIAISTQPFAIKIRHRFTMPRKWKENEICYFANFGSRHFEKWDGSSLDSGIGGSETAVVELSHQWAALGYHVTVYGDPITRNTQEIGKGSVTYLPWYYFNKNDSFNIFIQWRGWQLAGVVKTRKFYVDLHDIYSSVDMSTEEIQNIDKIFVKSQYHRLLGQNIPDHKFQVVSNGITL